MFYNDTQSFPIFLKILIRLKVGVFDRAVKLDPPIEVFCKNSKMFEIFLSLCWQHGVSLMLVYPIAKFKYVKPKVK
jgi:hypothetical protein